MGVVNMVIDWVFQSTHPVRGATPMSDYKQRMIRISIHAPREGCDEMGAGRRAGVAYFNPRTP